MVSIRAMNTTHFTYFAYGSNLLTQRLRSPDRCPSAGVIAPGVLLGYRLKFHKLGRDGSGKCDIWPTGNESDQVHGVLFRIAHGDQPNLDQAESLGIGYRDLQVTIQAATESVPACTYQALQIQTGLKPFNWYLQLILAGARQHQFPPAYLALLANVATQSDPDHHRRDRHLALLTFDQSEIEPLQSRPDWECC